MATHPGVYCLRSNEMDWDEERMWRTYTMLTDLESVPRMKSDQGWRRCSTRRRIAPMATSSIHAIAKTPVEPQGALRFPCDSGLPRINAGSARH